MTFPTKVLFLSLAIWISGTIVDAAETGAPSSTNRSETAKPAAQAETPPKPKLEFQVDRYDIEGNTLLSTNTINRILAPFTGPKVDLDTIQKALGALQLEYYQRGYVTVKITAPPQQVTNRVILFHATEGKVTAVKILHNRYYSSNNIVRALPYVNSLITSNRMLNAKIFQAELDRANSKPDLQISPEIRAGLEPGTSALVLDVKDRLPLHGRLEFDNYTPPNTPDLRLNANATYDNLWQLDHSAGFQYGFSPEREKPSLGSDTHLSLNPLDGPEVSYYSGFYRAPLGAPESVEQQISQDETHFGYNEVTHQFVLPPESGRVEFSAYASRSTTAPTLSGPVDNVVNTSLLNINEQMIQQQYTGQTMTGARLSFPIPTFQEIHSSWSLGVDYKEDAVITLPTNYFYYRTTVTNGVGVQATGTTISTKIAIPGAASYPSLDYTPLSLGWTGSRQDHWGQIGNPGNLWNRFDGSLSLLLGTGTFSGNKSFPTLIGNTPEATTGFVVLRPQLSRLQNLPENFTFYNSLSGQWANEPLLNLEQFALGGHATVPGYYDGEVYADTGFLEQAEVRTPVYWRGVNRRIGSQFTLFTDYGAGYDLDPARQGLSHEALWGSGLGGNFFFGSHVESHLIVGFPLLNGPYTESGHVRVAFSLSAQF